MARAFTILALALALLGLGARAAAAKPKVSVLGVEVGGGAIDQTSTAVAHDVTEGLRGKAKQGGGPFSYAPNSDRELIDEKVLKNCDSEGPLCMSDIGKELGADVLIYGKLEPKGDGYKVTLHVLDVRKKSREKDLDIAIPGGANSDAVRSLAKKAYAQIVGGGGGGDDTEPAGGGTGTLVISANVDGGTVFVDDDQKETLAGGKATLTLPEGRYRVAIESPGHRRKEKAIRIAAGDSVSEEFDLSEESKGGGGKSNGWRPAFYVAAGVTIALAGASLYHWSQELSDESLIKARRAANNGDPPLSDADCGKNIALDPADEGGYFQSACDHYKWHLRTLFGAIGTGGVAAFFGYMAFLHHSSAEPSTSAARKSKRKPASSTGFAIVPTVDEQSGGAVVFGTF